MTQGTSDRFWQAEARSVQTRQPIRDIKCITRRKFTAEEKIRIVLEGFRPYRSRTCDTLTKSQVDIFADFGLFSKLESARKVFNF